MEEDLRLETVRLREYVHRIRRVCELHRKMGEDAEFEIRELKRKVEALKKRVTLLSLHFARIASAYPEETKLCSSVLSSVVALLEK